MKVKSTIIKFISLLFVICMVAIIGISNIKINEISYVEVNDVLKTIEENKDNDIEELLKKKSYDFEYVVFDNNEEILIKSSENCPGSLKEAIEEKCISAPIIIDGEYRGSLVINNDSDIILKEYKKVVLIYILVIFIVAIFIVLGYSIYLNKRIISPFNKLRDFAKHVAYGKLDMPLEMDRNNIFGAFTESFDIMREQLFIARENEKKANESKKELVASLSHDIKTPLASIKAISEVMAIKEEDEKKSKRLNNIWNKANMIEMLINNLFHATLEEMEHLKVENNEEESSLIKNIINEVDYKNLVDKCSIDDCIVFCDKLRLQQVIDNIISNSYKYAETKIDIHTEIEDKYLKLVIRDYGQGLKEKEIIKIKEKFYRGSNSKGKVGYGMGIYVSNYFMENMEGGLEFRNANPGLEANIYLKLV